MTNETKPASRAMRWTGYILTALVGALLIFSGVMKLMKPAAVLQGFAHYGWPESTIPALGVVEILCAVVYLIPRTSVLGAILVAGFMGGATATVARLGEFWVPPVIVGVLAWGGIFLRDARIRALIPLKIKMAQAQE